MLGTAKVTKTAENDPTAEKTAGPAVNDFLAWLLAWSRIEEPFGLEMARRVDLLVQVRRVEVELNIDLKPHFQNRLPVALASRGLALLLIGRLMCRLRWLDRASSLGQDMNEGISLHEKRGFFCASSVEGFLGFLIFFLV